jgi:DNA-binding NarL/FixJ family response regulator
LAVLEQAGVMNTDIARPIFRQIPIGVLVVDDFKPFRALVWAMLENKPGLRIIAEATDGQEAVERAEQLRPDLVLLDIGLPRLDGIAAARQIRKTVPNSKILFLSQETSADVVQEAISVGGVGYVAKAKVATELLKAIEKVLLGKPFIGSGLARGDGGNRNGNNLTS